MRPSAVHAPGGVSAPASSRRIFSGRTVNGAGDPASASAHRPSTRLDTPTKFATNALAGPS